MSAFTTAKAARLKVAPVPEARTYAVQGDTAVYAVGEVATCTCRARVACSHREAAIAEDRERTAHLGLAAAA